MTMMRARLESIFATLFAVAQQPCSGCHRMLQSRKLAGLYWPDLAGRRRATSGNDDNGGPHANRNGS